MNAHKIDVSGAVLHSDHGFQYTSTAYNTRLEKFGSKASGADWQNSQFGQLPS
ncbi:hypothetical protein IAQ67_13140 [Paenibacillus peoriae]|uniref:Transposase n=1 Tax=Paenibacillus peoriae TaxID=59893 RepID=A0A7H0YFK8_9BACL|nr:hypothetical protein [Paenibacillus peoriae]QNR69866.1 hypothetical protein IAQ67_13140 [Paenibacillus peoriae]